MVRQILVKTGLLAAGIGIGVFVFGPGIVEGLQNGRVGKRPAAPSAEAAALHRSLVVADLHAGTLLWGRDLLQWGERGHVDLPRLEAGNVAVQVFATVTRATGGLGSAAPLQDPLWTLGLAQRWPLPALTDPLARADFYSTRLRRLERRAGGRLRILRSASDLSALLDARSRGETVTGAVLALEGGHALEAGPETAAALFDLGYRIAGLTNGMDSAFAGGIKGPGAGGLTPRGEQAIAAIEAAGLILDAAGASPPAALAMLDTASRPLLVSSTPFLGTCPKAVGLPLSILEAIARSGGLIGIAVAPDSGCDASADGVAKAIRMAAERVGPRAVALGTDFDGQARVGFDASELAALTEALLKQGVGPADIAGFMGGNAVRFLGARLPAE
jgi:microsomal dipeptidase-like Zn-dependent dipeptidase